MPEMKVGDELNGKCSGWVNVGRGYGFISVDGFPKDIFVPARNLINAIELVFGDEVAFEVRLGYDGKLMADHVAVVAPATREATS